MRLVRSVGNDERMQPGLRDLSLATDVRFEPGSNPGSEGTTSGADRSSVWSVPTIVKTFPSTNTSKIASADGSSILIVDGLVVEYLKLIS